MNSRKVATYGVYFMYANHDCNFTFDVVSCVKYRIILDCEMSSLNSVRNSLLHSILYEACVSLWWHFSFLIFIYDVLWYVFCNHSSHIYHPKTVKYCSREMFHILADLPKNNKTISCICLPFDLNNFINAIFANCRTQFLNVFPCSYM